MTTAATASPRDRAILALLGVGLRRSELVTIDDIDDAADAAMT